MQVAVDEGQRLAHVLICRCRPHGPHMCAVMQCTELGRARFRVM